VMIPVAHVGGQEVQFVLRIDAGSVPLRIRFTTIEWRRS
jgi:hypothetical protein